MDLISSYCNETRSSMEMPGWVEVIWTEVLMDNYCKVFVELGHCYISGYIYRCLDGSDGLRLYGWKC